MALDDSVRPPKETTDNPVQAEWRSRVGVIYFVGAGNPPVAIKIGVTSVRSGSDLPTALRDRLRKIQTSNHETIELLGAICFLDGPEPTHRADTLERELHVKFAAQQRFRPGWCGSEWFTASPDLLTYVREHSNIPNDLTVPTLVAQPINRSDFIGRLQDSKTEEVTE